MTGDIVRALKKFFRISDRLQADLSARWRVNANRRSTIIIAVVGLCIIGAYLTFVRAPSRFPVDELVTIPSGSTTGEAAQILKDASVVRSTIALRVIVRLFGSDKAVRAGDYLFKQPEDVFSVAHAISVGAFGLEPERIRVPEGATVKQMSQIFGTYLKRFNVEGFSAKAQSLEGYLFPDTYFFLPNANEDAVILALRQNFEQHLHASIEGMGSTTLSDLIEHSGKSESDIVILASIIEREARNTKDRRLISGVLWNRLKLGMALQVDATFLYTLGKGTFQLTLQDLASDSPYNTYKNKGLPPTPIGSPSYDSLLAAVLPTKSKYLYFLADHTGVTHYCEDWACQSANKALYF